MLRASLLTSLHAAQTAAVALCAAVGLPGDAGVPEWVHLLPAGEIRTGDGRGPYRIASAPALLAASLPAGEKLPIDENHATDLAAPRGEPAPARGWIVELQARNDGVWGRVEWTAAGRRLVAGRAYRGISPVIQHTKSGEVVAILRASLVNRPNLRGLAALHQENDMTLLEKLLAAAGLDAGTTEEAAIAAIAAMHQAQGQAATALQAALDPIATAIGLQAGADAGAVLTGVKALKTGAGDNAVVTALQAELATVTTKLNELSTATARDKATAFVDGLIKAGTVGVKPMRDHYIAMHMADPARVEKELGALPKLAGSGLAIVPPPAADGSVALQAEQLAVAKLLGIDPKKMAETIKAERETA